MRYRLLSSTGDYTFGQRGQNFLVNSPATVAQAISTRLKLFQGEWFLDLTVGVAWLTQVVGYGTKDLYDIVLQAAITTTPGVESIVSYSSSLDSPTRKLKVSAVVQTIYSGDPVVIAEQVQTGFGIGPFGNTKFGD